MLGDELPTPGSLAPKPLENLQERVVRYSDLDYNGHMNNCKYLDWVADLLDCRFHGSHQPKEITLNYLSEAREGEALALHWALEEGNVLTVQTGRVGEDVSTNHSRVFACRIQL